MAAVVGHECTYIQHGKSVGTGSQHGRMANVVGHECTYIQHGKSVGTGSQHGPNVTNNKSGMRKI
jgi:hypothetical protein